ncbi:MULTISPECIES: hypothetical protein [Cyanophyceae]|uniref:hypothetical protein n=1 Tax=Cyanophyceae TaxID=3028117 RepID=UPI001684FA36|nr:hypothetical protein [Coleofasciculus sp. FACHB-712]
MLFLLQKNSGITCRKGGFKKNASGETRLPNQPDRLELKSHPLVRMNPELIRPPSLMVLNSSFIFRSFPSSGMEFVPK